MSSAMTYQEFFRGFVLRKKQEIVNPQFHGIGEVILPKMSLIHFLPKLETEYGPSTSEAFISNFPKEVYIEFVLNGFNPIMGHGRTEKFDTLKAIQAYRGSHYTYSWTRDINTVYKKENALVIKNYGLIPQGFVYRPSIFMQYEKYYNNQHMLMEGINAEAVKGLRKQFLRVDLPLVMPSFTELCDDYAKFVSGFVNGLPVLTKPMLETTKAENSYWLLDLLAFLTGQYQFSLFNKLTPKAMEDLHILFTFQSKALVVNLGMLKGWLDETNPKTPKLYPDARKEFEGSKSLPRFNAVKRFYLALMSLSRNLVPEKEIVKEEQNDGTGEANTPGTDSPVAQGSASQTDQKQTGGNAKAGNDAGTGTPGNARANPGSILDVLGSGPADNARPDEDTGAAGSGSGNTDLEEWTSQVNDQLLEVEKVTAELNTSKVAFPTPESGVEAALNERAKDGVLTVAEKEFFMRKATRYQHIEMENGQTFEEFIQIKPEELKDVGGHIEGRFLTVLDESMLRSRATSIKLDYPQRFLQKDVAKMFLGMQNAGYALNDYKHEVVTSVEGSFDVYSVQLHDPNGVQTTIHPRTPRVLKDGSFIVDGVKSHLQQQRREKPFRKIAADTVALTTYYDRKLMVKRSEKMVDNLEKFMVKQISLQSKVNGYSFSKGGGSNINHNYVMPRIYSMLAKQYKTITVGDITLDFQIDDLLAKYPEYQVFTKPDRFLVGVKDKQPLTLDTYGNLFQGDTQLQPVEELLGLPMRKAPLEHAVINISGFSFPLGVVLCYYFGIDALLKAVKATTRSVPIGTRPKLSDDEYLIKFNDEYLIFNRREKLTTMVFGGMPDLNNISNFSRSDLNKKGIWHALMGDPKVRPSMFQEMQNLYDLFIDPISREELKKMKLSESFHWLLIDAAKALEHDYSRHSVEIEEQRIVGYERFAGHIYTELCRSVRQHRNKGKSRKHKLDFNPDAVIQNIGKDRSVNLVEEVNPVHQVKDQEEVTFGGDGGQSEITVTKKSRTQLPSFGGKISEANKDSSKVGYVTYLTSDPAIADFRGNVELNHKRTPTGDSSVTMNLQYGGTHDDPKRASFTSTQASQAVSAANYQINTLRTGYENVLAHRTSELYSKVAAEDGKVVEVVDDCLTVEYKDGTKDKYPLGLVIGEAAGEYHRHTRVTDLKVGDKFQKGDVIGWDDQWFARDPFCPGQVAWKAGKMVRIAMVEDQDVYEDSIAISKELAQEARTPFLKVNRFPIEVEHNLIMKVKVGDTIEQDAILCNIEEPHLGAAEDASDLEDELNKYGIKQIRAKHHGKIVAIEVRYNSPMDKMSESVRSFIVKKDKETKRKGDVEGSGVTSNAIHTAFNVNRPTIAPGKAYISICIESMDPSTNADKYVLGNQMKATVGRIMDRVMKTKSGQVIDIKASFKGMFNRMVLSLRNKLVANEYSYQITQKAIKAYRGK